MHTGSKFQNPCWPDSIAWAHKFFFHIILERIYRNGKSLTFKAFRLKIWYKSDKVLIHIAFTLRLSISIRVLISLMNSDTLSERSADAWRPDKRSCNPHIMTNAWDWRAFMVIWGGIEQWFTASCNERMNHKSQSKILIKECYWELQNDPLQIYLQWWGNNVLQYIMRWKIKIRSWLHMWDLGTTAVNFPCNEDTCPRQKTIEKVNKISPGNTFWSCSGLVSSNVWLSQHALPKS